jgi:hypothetical protein
MPAGKVAACSNRCRAALSRQRRETAVLAQRDAIIATLQTALAENPTPHEGGHDGRVIEG